MASPDELFNTVEHCEIRGTFRGNANFKLYAPRPDRSIKSGDNPWGGGINGGVIVLRPSNYLFGEMMHYLRNSYTPPARSAGGEQDFLSKFFAKRKIFN